MIKENVASSIENSKIICQPQRKGIEAKTNKQKTKALYQSVTTTYMEDAFLYLI